MSVYFTTQVNTQNNAGHSLLHLAAEYGHAEVVQFLILKGANVYAQDNEDRTALYLAAANGHYEAVWNLVVWRHPPLEPQAMDAFFLRPRYMWNYQPSLSQTTRTSSSFFSHIFSRLWTTWTKWTKLPPTQHHDVTRMRAVAENAGQVGTLLKELPENCIQCEDIGLKDAAEGFRLAMYSTNANTELSARARTWLRDIDDLFASRRDRFQIESMTLMFKLKHELISCTQGKNLEGIHEWDIINVAQNLEKVIWELGRVVNVNIPDQNGRTALHQAAKKGNEDMVQLLLQSGANANIQEEDGSTALHLAVDNAEERTVRRLLSSSLDFESQGQRALELNVKNGNIGIMQLLLDKYLGIKKGNDQRVLGLVVEMKLQQPLELLLKKGIDVQTQEGQKALVLATEKMWRTTLELLLENRVDVKNKIGQKALVLATEQKWRATLELLLNNSVVVKNDNGQKALGLVVNEIWLTALKLLLKNGVDVRTESARKALVIAAYRERTDLVELLVKHGVNVKTDEGEKAILSAARGGYNTIARILLDAKANVNSKDAQGKTVLDIASDNEHWKMVQILLEAGADVNVPDLDAYQKSLGQVMLRRACDAKRKDMALLILRYGVDDSALNSDSQQWLQSLADKATG